MGDLAHRVWMFFDRQRNLRLALDTSQAIAGSTTSRGRTSGASSSHSG